jgi:Flp pilus assembly protein TadG
MTGPRRPDEDGSLLVELVILTPVLVGLALLALVFGRVTEARQLVTESSRAAAQAAAVMPTAQSAQFAAADNAVIGGYAKSRTCARAWVVTDVSNFHPGGAVTVTVTCNVDLSDLSLPGIPGSTQISVTTSAPVDPYRAVQ